MCAGMVWVVVRVRAVTFDCTRLRFFMPLKAGCAHEGMLCISRREVG